jgi:hypothetical protein
VPLDRALSLTLALLIGSALVPNSSAANLAYSTYLKDGFTPKAMVSASRANPARLGSVVSFYVHGIGSPGCFCFGAAVNTQSAAVVNVVTVNSFLTRADEAFRKGLQENVKRQAAQAKARAVVLKGAMFGQLIGKARSELLALYQAASMGQYGAATRARCRNKNAEEMTDEELRSWLEDIERLNKEEES